MSGSERDLLAALGRSAAGEAFTENGWTMYPDKPSPLTQRPTGAELEELRNRKRREPPTMPAGGAFTFS